MTDQLQSQSGTTPQSPEIPALQNSAVQRCAHAWQRTYDLVSLQPQKSRAKEDYDGFAEEQARDAFRDAMPPLAGLHNIQDFIACVGHAMLHDIFLPEQCRDFLTCAKLALAALRSQPVPGRCASQ